MLSPGQENAEPQVAGLERIELPYQNRFGYSASVNAFLLVRDAEAVLIDTGFGKPEHAQLILEKWQRLGEPRVAAILLTHGHSDHSGGAAGLRSTLGAQLLIHPHDIPVLQRREFGGEVFGCLTGGAQLRTSVGTLEVLHTPGHCPGHVSFFWPERGVLLSGDVALSNSSTLVSYPDGNLTLYLETLRRLLDVNFQILAPGHGPLLREGRRRALTLLEHRLRREGEILALLRTGVHSVADLASHLYRRQSLELGEKMIEQHLHHLANGDWIVQEDELSNTWSIRQPKANESP